MEISRLFGKPKTYKIGGEEFTFKPLELNDIDTLTELGDPKKQGEAMKKLVIKTFRKSYPEVKEEDILKISVEHFTEITKAILDVNNVEAPKELK